MFVWSFGLVAINDEHTFVGTSLRRVIACSNGTRGHHSHTNTHSKFGCATKGVRRLVSALLQFKRPRNARAHSVSGHYPDGGSGGAFYYNYKCAAISRASASGIVQCRERAICVRAYVWFASIRTRPFLRLLWRSINICVCVQSAKPQSGGMMVLFRVGYCLF